MKHPRKRHTTGQAPRLEIKALKAFSQNFLHDGVVLEKMQTVVHNALLRQQAGETRPSEEGITQHQGVMLEVGPGTGALTRKICNLGGISQIIAVEKDPRAALYLKQNLLPAHPNLSIVPGNILKFDLHTITPRPNASIICVGNLPYAISSEFLQWFCEHKAFFHSGHFLLQREVVERVSAQTGTKAYGRLGAFVQLHFESAVHFDVLPQSFEPQPKVTSSFFSLSPKPFEFESRQMAQVFENTTAVLFSSRRKMLRKTLEHLFIVQNIPYAQSESILLDLLKRHGVAPTDRPESLTPQCLLEITQFLWKSTH